LSDLLNIAGEDVKLGQRCLIELNVASMATGGQLNLELHVIRGMRPGPVLLVSAALHGDEINGTEVVRRLLRSKSLKGLKGTLLLLPVMNPLAFMNRSRYLPDRRDLNRLFPGASSGSMGSRLAHVVCQQILPLADYVIDLHSASADRVNLSQVRVTEGDECSRKLAESFGAPVIAISAQRDGTFRKACKKAKKPCLLYEAGESGRLDAHAIRFGQQGVLSVMRSIGMIRKKSQGKRVEPVVCLKSVWERASEGGLFIPLQALGKAVVRYQLLGYVANPITGEEKEVKASRKGVIIGRTNQGLVDEGDALFHLGLTGDPDDAEEMMAMATDTLHDLDNEPDDDPVSSDPFQDA